MGSHIEIHNCFLGNSICMPKKWQGSKGKAIFPPRSFSSQREYNQISWLYQKQFSHWKCPIAFPRCLGYSFLFLEIPFLDCVKKKKSQNLVSMFECHGVSYHILISLIVMTGMSQYGSWIVPNCKNLPPSVQICWTKASMWFLVKEWSKERQKEQDKLEGTRHNQDNHYSGLIPLSMLLCNWEFSLYCIFV